MELYLTLSQAAEFKGVLCSRCNTLPLVFRNGPSGLSYYSPFQGQVDFYRCIKILITIAGLWTFEWDA